MKLVTRGAWCLILRPRKAEETRFEFVKTARENWNMLRSDVTDDRLHHERFSVYFKLSSDFCCTDLTIYFLRRARKEPIQ